MNGKIDLLGWLFIAYHSIILLVGVVIFIVLLGIGAIPGVDHEATAVLGIIGTALFFFFVVMAAPGIIGGIGLLKRQNWARILVIILSILNLLAVPFGTALGIFGLWLLLKEESTAYFVQK